MRGKGEVEEGPDTKRKKLSNYGSSLPACPHNNNSVSGSAGGLLWCTTQPGYLARGSEWVGMGKVQPAPLLGLAI